MYKQHILKSIITLRPIGPVVRNFRIKSSNAYIFQFLVDDILNICVVEHEHYFFAYLTVCLATLLTSPKLRKELYVSHK